MKIKSKKENSKEEYVSQTWDEFFWLSDKLDEDYEKNKYLLDIDGGKKHREICLGAATKFSNRGVVPLKIACKFPKKTRKMQRRRYITSDQAALEEIIKIAKNMHKFWSIEEDKILFDAVMQELNTPNKVEISWKKIMDEEFFGTRTIRQLKYRWENKLSPYLGKQGVWTYDQKVALLEHLDKAFKSGAKFPYADVCVAMKGERSNDCCRSKWLNITKIMSKRLNISRDEVTPEMVLKLIKEETFEFDD